MVIWLLTTDLGGTAALGQAGRQEAAIECLMWMGAIIMALLMAVVVVLFIRKRLRAARQPGGPDFSLEQLRRLRDQGSLTDEEYEAIKQKSIAQTDPFNG